ncbi:MAG: DoxX family membrane protein [Puniceicoccales bacterium]|nr:DoxX family membrane protein [Puniceicoccales bacterium]
MSASINFDSENFGKLFMRLFLGIFFMANGVHFFAYGHSALAILGKMLGAIGIHFSPVIFGGILATIHIVCGLTVVIGFFFRTSCFLLGLISLLKVAVAILAGGSITNDTAYAFTVGMTMFGMMFTGGGRFAAGKQ